jgi:hypothetical protein
MTVFSSRFVHLHFLVAGFSSSKSPNVWMRVGTSCVRVGLKGLNKSAPLVIGNGQGNVSYTSVAAALGLRLSVCVALKGRNK